MENEEKKVTAEVKKSKDFQIGIGRRGSAIARVRIYSKVPDNLKFGDYVVKKGDIVVNGKNALEYFSGTVSKFVYEEPLKATNALNKYAITVRAQGGGVQGQLTATVLGIARALSVVDPLNRPLLRKKGLLTRDSRVRERRKVGMGGKSRRKRQSPKR